MVLFPRPWAPLIRHRWLLPVVCAAPVALVVWFLPELILGEALLRAQWLGFSGLLLLAGLTVANETMQPTQVSLWLRARSGRAVGRPSGG